MRLKQFDVVEIKNGNKAVILEQKGKEYFAETLDNLGNTLEYRNISVEEIEGLVFSKERER